MHTLHTCLCHIMHTLLQHIHTYMSYIHTYSYILLHTYSYAYILSYIITTSHYTSTYVTNIHYIRYIRITYIHTFTYIHIFMDTYIHTAKCARNRGVWEVNCILQVQNIHPPRGTHHKKCTPHKFVSRPPQSV